MRSKIMMILLVLSIRGLAQPDTLLIIDTVAVSSFPNAITNAKMMLPFYQKLADLQQHRKSTVNIVHIGDSHIQADLMTAQVRRNLQQEFGNAGRGFVFPHNLAKTNGASDVKFSSTANWYSHRNIHMPDGSKVGLSGIALGTKNSDFAIRLSLKDSANYFKRIKIITPENSPVFTIATEKRIIATEALVPKKVTHKIRRGETLSEIADRYQVGVAELKRFNDLRSANIRAGATLRIPIDGTQSRTIDRATYMPLTMQQDVNSHYFDFTDFQNELYVIPAADGEHVLSGIVLENGAPGILYHNIGVNGAKFSDYNKYPLFFTQLSALMPDLIVLSLGTNESFDKMPVADYMVQMRQFIDALREQHPNVAILVATPPPSLFSRRVPNHFVEEYARAITQLSDVASWDLYNVLGGNSGIAQAAKRGIIGADRVHYSKAGYELQGDLLFNAILQGLTAFKQQ